MGGLSYAGYLSVARASLKDPRNPPEVVSCENVLHLANWLKLFGYACRATREGIKY